MAKDTIKEYIACECGGIQFRKEYIFSVEFHSVNFSEDMVYDRKEEEVYVCNVCSREISYDVIRQRMRDIKAKHKHIDSGNGDV